MVNNLARFLRGGSGSLYLARNKICIQGLLSVVKMQRYVVGREFNGTQRLANFMCERGRQFAQ